MIRTATFSKDRAYRYTLSREWQSTMPRAVFICLNPSVASEYEDDPTVRKCIGFAKRWGCGSLTIVNLFALVETDPAKMKRHPNPIGDENDAHIQSVARSAAFVIAAWGGDGSHMNRAADVCRMLNGQVKCLGRTRDGFPRHPVMRAYAAALESFDPSQSSKGVTDFRNPA